MIYKCVTRMLLFISQEILFKCEHTLEKQRFQKVSLTLEKEITKLEGSIGQMVS